MTVIFVSPAEPASVKSLFERTLTQTTHEMMVSSKPETMGVDFLWRARGGWYGVQRKELSDLLASMQDGRLSKELGQMAGMGRAWVIIEGEPQWTLDGALLNNSWGRPFTVSGWVGLLSSIQAAGAHVLVVPNVRETCTTITHLINYTIKPSHNTATSRPGAQGGKWGHASSRDWGVHLLQSFPGIGPEVAGAIYDHFGGVPMRWTVNEQDLLAVAGIGKGRAGKLIAALRSPVPLAGEDSEIAS